MTALDTLFKYLEEHPTPNFIGVKLTDETSGAIAYASHCRTVRDNLIQAYKGIIAIAGGEPNALYVKIQTFRSE